MTRFDLSRNPVAPNELASVVHKDMSLGVNNRQEGTMLAENQAEELLNLDIDTPAKRKSRLGSVQIGDNPDGDAQVVELMSYEVQGSTDQLLRVCGGNVRKWTGSGDWSNIIMGGIDSYVKLMLHLDNNVTDSSTDGVTVTNSNVTFDNTNYKFGTHSAVFNGTTGILTAVDSASWYFGTGDWEIDFWVRFSALTNEQVFVGQYEGATKYWRLYKTSNATGNKLGIQFVNGTAKGEYIMTSAWSGVATNTWYHLKFLRTMTSGKIAIDGAHQTLTETTAFSTNDVGNLTGNLEIGALNSSTLFSGNIDELRISKGISRYGSDFDVETKAYTTSVSGSDVSITVGKESGLTPDDIVIVQDGTNNARRIDSNGNIQDLGDTNTSPPKTTVMAWHGNRFWGLLNDLAYYSDAYDDDYSGAFDRTSNWFRVHVGEERAIISTRDLGIVFAGRDAVWTLLASPVPAVTDQPLPFLPEHGFVSKKGWCIGGDDIYFFSKDGLRGLKRTAQDKLQMGITYPLSYQLKTQFEAINWGRINELSMEYFDNRVICTVPTSTTSYMTWVYYPAFQSIVAWDGKAQRCYSCYKVSGEERIYYGHYSNGKVYRDFYGFTDEGTTTTNGTAIHIRETSRKETFGNPLVKKEGHTFGINLSRDTAVNVLIYAQFDDSGWEYLGTLALSGSGLITFPTTFPVVFADVATQVTKYHTRRYGKFFSVQFRYEITDALSAQLTVLETSATAFIDPYMEE